MNRIRKVFEDKKVFIAFVTGGDPDIETTEMLIPQMAAAGADIIEIGIPFSDPVAEGKDVQEADMRALAAGATTDKLFDMVGRIRDKVNVPLVFMTYMNPVYTYGTERFAKRCGECGIDGLIIPDLPYEEKDEVKGACDAAGITLISMISPASENRIEMIAREAEGFLYYVSPRDVTENADCIGEDIKEMTACAKKVSDIPCAIGFGRVSVPQVHDIADLSDGVIAGSDIVRIIGEYGRACVAPVCSYVKEMKEAMASA